MQASLMMTSNMRTDNEGDESMCIASAFIKRNKRVRIYRQAETEIVPSPGGT